jgi:uncharacterized Zn finger protein
VYYLLGEEFDRDPFLMFTMRGLTREELFERLDRDSGSKAVGQVATEPASTTANTPAREPEPLATDPTLFWNGQALGDDIFGEVVAPPVVAALPKRLGGFPFWRGERPLLTSLEPAYTAATPRALDLFVGQQQGQAEAKTSTSS